MSWINPVMVDRVLETAAAWSLRTLPAAALTTVLGLFALRVTRVVAARAETFLLARAVADDPAHASEAKKRTHTLVSIATTAVRVGLGVALVLLVLVQLGIDVAPLLAGAGIVGLAVGFGAQELVRDVISGFFLLLENHIRQGDVAIINGTGGLVERIGLRTIELRDQAGTVHVFQNGKINSLANMTKGWSAVVFDIGVAYREDTDRVVAVMREVAEELRTDEGFASKIREPLEVLGVDAFADSAVVIRARFKTQPIEQWVVGREFRRRLKKAFDRENIEIPFPQRTLHVRTEGSARADSNRTDPAS
jgi:small conductance mechanosensitive channel